MDRGTRLGAGIAINLRRAALLVLGEIALFLRPLLEPFYLSRSVPKEHQAHLGVLIETVREAVQTAVDLLGDLFDIALVGVPVERLAGRVADGPVPDGRQTFPRIGVDEVRVGLEVRRVETLQLAPVEIFADVVGTGHLDRAAAGVLLAVAVLLRRVAQIGASVVAQLSLGIAPELPVVPKVAAFVKQLRDELS